MDLPAKPEMVLLGAAAAFRAVWSSPLSGRPAPRPRGKTAPRMVRGLWTAFPNSSGASKVPQISLVPPGRWPRPPCPPRLAALRHGSTARRVWTVLPVLMLEPGRRPLLLVRLLWTTQTRSFCSSCCCCCLLCCILSLGRGGMQPLRHVVGAERLSHVHLLLPLLRLPLLLLRLLEFVDLAASLSSFLLFARWDAGMPFKRNMWILSSAPSSVHPPGRASPSSPPAVSGS